MKPHLGDLLKTAHGRPAPLSLAAALSLALHGAALAAAGADIRYVKPHGALGNLARLGAGG